MTTAVNFDKITLESGVELAEPPVVMDSHNSDLVDNERTGDLHEQLKAWGEIAHGIVSDSELTDSGELQPEDSKALRAAYADLPAIPGKSYARSHAEEMTREALSDTSDAEAAFRVAQMWSKISNDQKKDTPKPRAERVTKPKATPTELATDKLASMKLAVTWFEANPSENEDDEIEDDFVENAEDKAESLQEMLDAYIEWLDMEPELDEDGEEVEKPSFEEHFGEDVDPVVRDAAKLARQKIRRGRGGGGSRNPYSGPRRSIGKHIEEAFARVEVGTFLTVSEIVNMQSEEYGEDRPSSGAVANRIFPPSGADTTIEGIEPGRDENGKQGATKIA